MEIAVTLSEFVDEVPTLVVLERGVQWLVEIAEPVAEKLQRLELSSSVAASRRPFESSRLTDPLFSLLLGANARERSRENGPDARRKSRPHPWPPSPAPPLPPQARIEERGASGVVVWGGII